MPSLATLDQAPLHILLHLTAAVLALLVGAFVLARRKGTTPHRWLGRTWAALMLFVALGSFWIQRSGGLNWIHLLSVLTIASVAYAVWSIRRGNLRAHRASMLFSYVGLCVAGAFTLLPQRLLGHLFFG
jgi:uncharacterized membrane protein